MLKKNYLTQFISVILIVLYCFISCNTTDPPIDKAELLLKLEDVSCTEAWITLTTNNLQFPAEINLTRKDAHSNSKDVIFYVSTADTLLYLDSLFPNRSYKIQASPIGAGGIGNPASGIRSNELSITTLDTTSHNFTFETWTFGDIGSSTLYDVAIINENSIWCVGDIKIADTSENGYTNYCYLKWNGIEWEKGKLKYFPPGSIGDSITTSGNSIFAFNEDDVWISGGAVFHWNGSDWKIYYDTGAEGSNKIWGTSSNDIYFVGRNGSIVHYNGSPGADGWTKIESGTDLSLSDIWSSNYGTIFSCGLRTALVKGVVLETSDGNNWAVVAEGENIPSAQIFNPYLFGSIASVWEDERKILYAAGNLLYSYKFDDWDYVKSLPENFIGGNPNTYYRGFINKIRGNSSNDMWIIGDRNTVRHFNGVSWEQIGFPYNPSSNIIWLGLSVSHKTVAITGLKGNEGIIMIVTR